MLEIHTRLEKGRIPKAQSDRIRDYLLKLGDSSIHIYIDKKRKPKSKEQRGYYWSCVLPTIFNFCQGTGLEVESPGQIHELMKRKFLTIIPQRPDGTLMEEKVISTESLNAKETEEYYEQIRRFWAPKGCYIPLPNEWQSVSTELI
jgi:hypothetical protein